MRQKNWTFRIIVTAFFLLIASILLIYFFSKERNIVNKASSVKIYMNKNADGSSSIVSSLYSQKAEQKISEWKLAYPIFHFECADINADGTTDILVGVIKKTRFDSICRKRIFIFKLFEGYVRPLWLGSRVSQPLEDFKVIYSKPMNFIRTIELEENGKYLVAAYKWKGFGLTFVKYYIRNVDLQKAIALFNKPYTDHENS
jgi:hypothetical protein